MSIVTRAHESWAHVYDEVYRRSFGKFYTDFTNVTLDVVYEHIFHGGRIVDFGAGTGRLSIPLAERGYRVTAVEPSHAMLKKLQQKKGTLPIACVETTMESFHAQESYDLALSVFTVIAYILDEASLEKALRSVYESLKLGGLFLLDIPSPQLFQSSRYQDSAMKREVTIEATGPYLYSYDEKIMFRTEEGETYYNDRFTIRHWDTNIVLEILEEVGFYMEEDLSERFMGSGASYYLLSK